MLSLQCLLDEDALFEMFIMKKDQFKQELEAAGCIKLRNGGRHSIYYSPMTKRTIAVPTGGSKEIPTGTERQIRKVLGVPKKS